MIIDRDNYLKSRSKGFEDSAVSYGLFLTLLFLLGLLVFGFLQLSDQEIAQTEIAQIEQDNAIKEACLASPDFISFDRYGEVSRGCFITKE